MEAFNVLTGLVVPIDRSNVDTDAIIPKQFMKSIARTGFGANLFDEWRYLDRGEPGQNCDVRPKNLEFSLNDSRYDGAQIMLTRDNFGCGSSREHAAWALHDFGIRALIAPSFADIFYGNCLKNGMLPVVLPKEAVDYLFHAVYATSGFRLRIDLRSQSVATDSGFEVKFEIEPFKKKCLLGGLDDIGLTLQRMQEIRDYESRRRASEPWLFSDLLTE
ncbi:3-isopropylmalate dehydratase small subunit [Paraburkholderia sp. LEh10]|uniref:3-isopropylmalate dehydratase small subunit n=1 Tax=Paraburkholderia sp. LEh10 TaxID=2821353 RepID=UPI001AE37A05|nr:3-isopropylmalate dehydratase small subunit [Paraburkholderia sp. LEh10]MBP0590447.1 3-isopropylmalate dehydratase small subunit [Paraburkholderia sp. LEh10]